MTLEPASADDGRVVLVRGIALWIALLGLSYLVAGLVMINLLHRRPAGSDAPLFQLPLGMSEGELLQSAVVIAATALFSSIQLFRLKTSGRILATFFLVAAAGWALWRSYLYQAELLSIVTAGLDLWFAFLLWRTRSEQ
jgi:xanthine/uracil/vitamin C permease (AzgA family)